MSETERRAVTLRFVNIVGMRHHTGSDNLTINEGYVVKEDPTNRFDPHALKVTDRSSDATRAYLTRGFRSLLLPIFRQKLIHGNMYIKPKFPSKFVARKMTQKCAIAFFVKINDLETVLRLLRNTGLMVEVHDV